MSSENMELLFRELISEVSGIRKAIENATKPAKAKVSKQATAIALVGSTGLTDLTKIAEELGCSRRTVERMTTLRAMIDGMNRVGEAHRGFKTTDGIDGVN